jgi:single-stranded-DNA-specific exonuclease
VIAGWGERPVGAAAPLLYVDRHADPEPVDGLVLHAGETGDRSTSLLAWRLLGPPPELAWLAPVGAVGDLGERALGALELGAAGPRTGIRRLATLASARGRLRDGAIDVASDLLAQAATAEEALGAPRIGELERARVAVDHCRRDAIRALRRLGDAAALVRLDVPAKVRSQVAGAGTRRLAPPIVVATDTGRRPDGISFAARSAGPIDLPVWLGDVCEPPPGSGDYARGHARATGGPLAPDAFKAFAAAVLEGS